MRSKIKDIIKENRWVFLTFLFSLIVVSAVYTIKKIAPFGINSMLDVDFYHQYGPMLNELVDRVKEGKSLLYSFNVGLGMPFYKNYLNYLSGPFNVILFLFKKENIVMAYSVIIGLKMVFASTFMAYFLKKAFNKNTPLVIVFGILYAFSGYFCAYYWNIMWLDGMVFLPIIMLGINRIIDFEKPLLYIISLALMLLSNYFIGYMICIFSVFYFIVLFLYRKNFKIKNIIKKILIFSISSLLAGGLVAFLLLPLFMSLKTISASKDSFPALRTSFAVTKYMFNHITAVNRTVFASDKMPLPNVYPGMITLAFLPILFLNRKINLRFKVITILMILFFFFSFNINRIDFIWHAFHVPNDLPYRYSFIYTFCLITVSYYSLLRIKDVGFIKISISFGILLLFVLLSVKLDFENIDDKKAIIAVMFLTLYYIIICIYKASKSKVFLYLLVLISMIESVYAISINWDINHNIKTFMSDKKPIMNLISKIRKNDDDLYRIEKTDYLTLNDGSWYNYYGVSTFSSMAYESVSKNQRMLGLAGNNINSYYYKEYTSPVYNTIFNVKYLIGERSDNDFYITTNKEKTYNVSEYKYSSSIGYLVKDLKSIKLEEYRPFYNQELIVKKMSGVDNIYEKVDIKTVNNGELKESANNEYYYNILNKSDDLEIILDNKKNDNIYLYLKGSDLRSFDVEGKYYSITSDEYYVLDIGKFDTNEVKLSLNLKDSKQGYVSLYAYYINKDNFMKFYNNINDNLLKVDKYSDTYISGTIDVIDNDNLFFNIPYDEGWTLLVDGTKRRLAKGLDTYLSYKLKKGHHKIELIYYPKYMKQGLIITAFSYVLVFIYVILKNNKKNKNIKKDEFIV